MVKILLANNQETIVDDCDAHLATITKYKWYLLKGKNKRTGYAYQMFTKPNGKRSGFFLHHLIIGYPLNDLQVDHINGNGLDNRRSNLRIVTRRQNQQNRFCYGNKKSKYTGVYQVNGKKNKWCTQLSYKGKQHHIGMYPTQRKAHEAYELALSNYLKKHNPPNS